MKIHKTKLSSWFWLLLVFIMGTNLITAQSGVNLVGSFEQDLPSYWKKGN